MNPYPTEDRTETGGPPDKDWEEPTRRQRRKRITNKTKGYIAGGFFVAWIVFVVIWLLFFASLGSFFDNVAVIASAFFVAVGAAGILFSGAGPAMHKSRIRVSIVVAMAFIIFVVLWFPFESAFFSFYHNAAIMFAAFMLFVSILAVTWVTVSPVPIFRTKGVVPFGVMLVWAVIVFCWLWFYAEGLTGNQNIAITLASFLLLVFLMIVVAKTSVRVEGEVSGYGALALFFGWIVVMMAWFWFFADSSGLNSYQNAAVVILSFLLIVALAYLWERRKHRKQIPDHGW